jgi:hypothetical protein
LVVTHPLRKDVAELAEKLAAALRGAGVAVRISSGETRSLLRPDALVVGDEATGATADLVLALGGDGTVLRAAKVAAEADIPLLGVNFGKVGFLAEAETGELETVVSRLLDGEYSPSRSAPRWRSRPPAPMVRRRSPGPSTTSRSRRPSPPACWSSTSRSTAPGSRATAATAS